MTQPNKQDTAWADGFGNGVISNQQAAIADLTDSTTGTAGDTLDDTTANQKDDVASLAAKINGILAVLRAHGLIAD